MKPKRTARFPLALVPVILLASFCLPTLPGQPVSPADEEEQELDPRDVVRHAKVSLRQAIQSALKVQPGIAVEAALEGEVEKGKTGIAYEVMVVAGEELYEVKLDPTNGEVIEKTKETDEEAQDELREFRTVLRHTDLTLDVLVAKAEEIVKGHVVATTLQFDDGGPECEVFFVNGRYVIETSLEARAGHLIEIELLGVREEGDDEEEDDGDEDDDDDDEDDDDDD